MQLQQIDKARYRKHLNRVIATVIVTLLAISLGSSTILIALVGDASDSHFFLNVTGVIIGASTIGYLLYRYQHHPYMHEIVYVWRLKQELNRIYRKLAKVKAAAETNDINALIILNFNLKASEQIYVLDDNDLTLADLKQEITTLDNKIESLGLDIHLEDYNRGLLDQLH